MRILVSPLNWGLQQEEKYQNIPRDRWGKWRESLQEKADARIIADEQAPQKKPKKPQNSGISNAPALKFTQAPDTEANLLFNATLLRPR